MSIPNLALRNHAVRSSSPDSAPDRGLQRQAGGGGERQAGGGDCSGEEASAVQYLSAHFGANPYAAPGDTVNTFADVVRAHRSFSTSSGRAPLPSGEASRRERPLPLWSTIPLSCGQEKAPALGS